MTDSTAKTAAIAAAKTMYEAETGEKVADWLALEFLHREAEAITYRDGWTGSYDEAFAQAGAEALEYVASMATEPTPEPTESPFVGDLLCSAAAIRSYRAELRHALRGADDRHLMDLIDSMIDDLNRVEN